MKLDQASWRWAVVCFSAVLAFFLWLANHEGGWDVLGVFHLRPYFADLVAILAAGDAQRLGLDVYQPNPLDPLGRPHVYGPWWLVLGQLGFTVHDAWWIGSLLGMGFVATALWLLAPRNWRGALLAVAMLVSPPVLLGLERGNNDLFVFIMLGGAAALLARPTAWAGIAGAGTLVLAAVLKLYPLAAVAGLLARRDRVSRLILMVVGSLAIFAGLWWLQREEFFRVLAIAPRPETFLAYGVRLFALVWDRGPSVQIWLALGYVLGAGVSLAFLWRGRTALNRWLTGADVATIAAVLGSSCWVFCYLANNNYPYRAVLLLLVVPSWLRLAKEAQPEARAAGRGLCGLLLVALWIVTPRWWAIGWMESSPGASPVPLRTLLPLIGAEQVMIAVLTGVMIYGLAHWAWRRAQELLVRE